MNEAIRIEIKRDGVYKYTFTDTDVAYIGDTQTLKLFTQGTEVPMKVTASSDGIIIPGDSVEFYGTALNSVYSDTRVYWLFGDGLTLGRKIADIDGGITGDAPRISSFKECLHEEENYKIWEATPGALDTDYWFWEKITAPSTLGYTINIPSLDPRQHQATIRVCFQGRSTASPHPNHHTLLLLNGNQIGDAFWDGDQVYIQEVVISSGLLQPGNNTFTLKSPGDTGASVDVIYFNWIEIEYQRLLEADQERLTFTIEGNGPLQIEIGGFTDPHIRVFDITEPSGIKEVIHIAVQPLGISATEPGQ